MIEIKRVNYSTLPHLSSPGKTHGKDIMLICKRWYNTNKYKTTKEALEQYYAEQYNHNKREILTYKFIIDVLLQPAIKEFMLIDEFKDKFIDFIFTNIPIKKPVNDYYENLYYRLIQFLDSLICCRKDADNELITIINTNDYFINSKEEITGRSMFVMLKDPIIEEE